MDVAAPATRLGQLSFFAKKVPLFSGSGLDSLKTSCLYWVRVCVRVCLFSADWRLDFALPQDDKKRQAV